MNKIKDFYRNLTPAQKARLWTLFITGLTALAATGDKIKEMPFLPGWLVNAWPVILAIDLAALKIIAIFSNPLTPQQPNTNS